MISALSTLKTIFFNIPNPILNANSYQGLFVYFTFKGLYEILTCVFFFLKARAGWYLVIVQAKVYVSISNNIFESHSSHGSSIAI